MQKSQMGVGKDTKHIEHFKRTPKDIENVDSANPK